MILKLPKVIKLLNENKEKAALICILSNIKERMKMKLPAGAAAKKYILVLFIIVVFFVYSFFSVIRPLEDDESLYVLTGRAIADGSLDPFTVQYYGHYSNPFHYIMGSPLMPLIYGIIYNAGGILLVRLLSSVFVLASVFLAYRMVSRLHGNPAVTLVLTALSASAITLASDGFLDSGALLFLMASLYFANGKNMFYAGVFSGFAIAAKFVLVVPVAGILIYQVCRKDWTRYLAGVLVIALPLLVLYRNLVPVILNFLLVTKVSATSAGNAGLLLGIFATALPLASVIAIVSAKSKNIRKYLIFLLPAVAVLLFQIALIDYNSLVRHLPYAEFPAAVLAGVFLKGRMNKALCAVLVAFACFSVVSAFSEANNYPSYNMISDQLADVNGKILALNLNSFMLMKGMPLNSTAETVYSYYYFNYDNVLGSEIREYEQALSEGFFDYAIISSYSSGKYSRYDMIEALVRKYYCPVLESRRPNGLDIYGRCS